MPQVAFFQLGVIPGGRLRVIVEIARVLNEKNIVPDLLTTHVSVDQDQIAKKYGQSIKINIRLLPFTPRLPHDFAIMLFNAMINYYVSRYDLLINSNNSLFFLPKKKNVISYIYFPHELRMEDNAISVHRPETLLPRWSRTYIKRAILRRIYSLNKPLPHHNVVGISTFTCDSILQVYNLPHVLPVIYPPIDCGRFVRSNNQERDLSIVTIGRYGPDKRQFEQILLAETLPNVKFHIVGFVNDIDYYKKCKLYQEERQISNVHFHPDAPFEKMVELLQNSKYFLHTLIKEPFGITTAQAISAGCLPIVHNSGGQREVVPREQLRFNQFEEIPVILERLEGMDRAEIQSLVDHLQKHVFSHFEASTFRASFRKILDDHLSNY